VLNRFTKGQQTKILRCIIGGWQGKKTAAVVFDAAVDFNFSTRRQGRCWQ
jgi:hypothetical protein